MTSKVDISDIAKQVEEDFGYKVDKTSVLLKNNRSQIIRLSEDTCIKISLRSRLLDYPDVLKTNNFLCLPIKSYRSSCCQCMVTVQRFLNLYNLQKIIKKSIQIPEKKAGKIIYCVLKGIESLHENRFVHRDMHPENIMLHIQNGELNAVIVDFDEMMPMQLGLKACYRFSGYNAPEIVRNDSHYDDKSEIFAIGVMFWELLYGECPFAGYNFFGRYIENDWDEFINNKERIEKRTYEAINTIHESLGLLKDLSSECAQALSFLVSPTPSERISAKEALSLPFFLQFQTK